MRNFGPTEILVILLIVLLLFGARRLPDAARGLGRSLRIFKSEMSAMQNDDKSADAPAEKAAEAPADKPADLDR